MRRHQITRTLILFSIFLLLTSACGKREDPSVLQDDNPVGAPPPPTVVDPTPTPMATPTPTAMPGWQGPTGQAPLFNRFNQLLGQCRNSFGHKGKLLGFLLQLLQERQQAPGNILYAASVSGGDLESRGFRKGQRGGACMGQLQNGMGRLRDLLGSGQFRPGTMQNWLGHSTDWAVSGVQYPTQWPSGSMPLGPLNSYYQGQTYFSQQPTSSNSIPILGGGYFQPTN